MGARRAHCSLCSPRQMPPPLQGEMGSTISKFPRDWAGIVDPLRERVGSEADVLVGIGARRRAWRGRAALVAARAPPRCGCALALATPPPLLHPPFLF